MAAHKGSFEFHDTPANASAKRTNFSPVAVPDMHTGTNEGRCVPGHVSTARRRLWPPRSQGDVAQGLEPTRGPDPPEAEGDAGRGPGVQPAAHLRLHRGRRALNTALQADGCPPGNQPVGCAGRRIDRRSWRVSGVVPQRCRGSRPWTGGQTSQRSCARMTKSAQGCDVGAFPRAAGQSPAVRWDAARRYSALMRWASSSWSSRMMMRQAASMGVPWSTSSLARAAMRSW